MSSASLSWDCQGLTISTPVGVKSATFRVTTSQPMNSGSVAAMSASRSGAWGGDVQSGAPLGHCGIDGQNALTECPATHACRAKSGVPSSLGRVSTFDQKDALFQFQNRNHRQEEARCRNTMRPRVDVLIDFRGLRLSQLGDNIGVEQILSGEVRWSALSPRPGGAAQNRCLPLPAWQVIR